MTKFTPQISIHILNFAPEGHAAGWQHLFDLAKAADRAGIDRVMVSDHVVYGEELEEYSKPEVGGRAGGKQPTGPDGHWLEPMTTLSVLAGMTTRVRLGTQILLAALRRPVILAKSAATLDVLSNGRLDLGIVANQFHLVPFWIVDVDAAPPDPRVRRGFDRQAESHKPR